MSTNLTPVVCKNETQVADAAFDGVRRRPVVAINDEGKLVVCCRRTAAKNGWALQGAMFQRKTGTVGITKSRRATDKEASVVVAKTKVTKAKADVNSALDDILGE